MVTRSVAVDAIDMTLCDYSSTILATDPFNIRISKEGCNLRDSGDGNSSTILAIDRTRSSGDRNSDVVVSRRFRCSAIEKLIVTSDSVRGSGDRESQL